MTPQEIVEQIMAQHWDLAACRCWVCVEGRKAGLGVYSQYLDWRGKLEYVSIPQMPSVKS